MNRTRALGDRNRTVTLRCRASPGSPAEDTNSGDPELGRGLRVHRRRRREKGPPGTRRNRQTYRGEEVGRGIFSLTHTARPQAGPEPPPCALRAQPRAAAATHPPRGSGFPTLSSAWWASRRPPQVEPQPGLCTCHGAGQAGDLAAPRRALSGRAGPVAHPGQRSRRTAPGRPPHAEAGGRGYEGGGVRRAGRALPAAAEGAARRGEELWCRRRGRGRRGARLLAPAAARRRSQERGGERPGSTSSSPPRFGPYHS